MTSFFSNVVREVMTYREVNKEKRNDFMELLIELKTKGRIDDADGIGAGRLMDSRNRYP